MFLQFLGPLSDAGQPALWWYSRLGTSNQIQGDYPFKIRQQTVSGGKTNQVHVNFKRTTPCSLCIHQAVCPVEINADSRLLSLYFLFFEPWVRALIRKKHHRIANVKSVFLVFYCNLRRHFQRDLIFWVICNIVISKKLVTSITVHLLQSTSELIR